MKTSKEELTIIGFILFLVGGLCLLALYFSRAGKGLFSLLENASEGAVHLATSPTISPRNAVPRSHAVGSETPSERPKTAFSDDLETVIAEPVEGKEAEEIKQKIQSSKLEDWTNVAFKVCPACGKKFFRNQENKKYFHGMKYCGSEACKPVYKK